MIEIEGLHKSLANQEVLKGVNLTIETGDIVSLLGASGSGKSVMLRNIVGLMTPDRGTVKINGVDIHNASAQEVARVRSDIGMLFQSGALFDSLTVYENLAFPLREKTDLTRSEIRDRIQKRLELVEMTGSENKYPAELSGGMQKRVALARALILDPRIIFFDEPTTGLDPVIANAILRLINRLHKEFQFTSVIVTHNFQKVFQIVHRVAMLHKGEIIAYNTPDEFLELPNEHVRSFVQEAMKGPLEALANESVD